jgi:hypothetical protein
MSDAETARDIFGEWLRHIVEERSDAPRTLWHYTNAAGLQGILESNRLWATDALYLNDAAEVRYGTDLVIETLGNLDLGHTKEDTRQFLFGLLDPTHGPLRGWLTRELRPFVTCFCSTADLLSQWRAYAGAGEFGGYAVGFTPPGALAAWAQTAPHLLALRRVIYDENVQVLRCQALLQPLVDFLDTDPSDRGRLDGFAAELVNGIAEVATWCKHPAFAEENEWRVVYYRLQDPDPLPVEHRIATGLIVPYVSLEVPTAVGSLPDVLPITVIHCGPSLDPDRKVRGVTSLLESLGMADRIRVSVSTTPARL